MSEAQELDLVFGVLDHQLVDPDGRRCGKVDDLELEGGPGEEPRVTAILTGTGYWRGRAGGLLAWLSRRLDARKRIEWDAVGEIKSAVELTSSAEELGLGRGDDRAARWIRRLPGA